MNRMLSNLYFLLFASIYLTSVYTIDLSYVYKKTKENISFNKDNVIEQKGHKLSESTYKRALPNKAYIDAKVSFREGKYVNKDYIRKRVENTVPSAGKPSPPLNKGRDSP